MTFPPLPKSRSFFKGSDLSAAINGSQRVPDPPIRSAFNGGGGGPTPQILSAQIWTAHERARRSTVLIEFRTPPRRSTFNGGGGGGGPELIISFEQIWTALNPALRSTVHNRFRTPPAVLPLTEGGGSGIDYKKCAHLNGCHASALIDGSWAIPGPPWYSVFNQRGGVRNKDLFHVSPCYTWLVLIGP
jgi:hypothetical protein